MGSNSIRKKAIWAGLSAFLVILITLSLASSVLVNWLWMERLGYEAVFLRILTTKLLLAGSAFSISFFFLWLNIRTPLQRLLSLYKTKDRIEIRTAQGFQLMLSASWINVIPGAIAFILALIFAWSYYYQWDIFLRFQYGGSFETVDPIFSRDIGYYIFRLPACELVQNGAALLTALAFSLCWVAYGSAGALTVKDSGQKINWPVVRHISILFLFFIAAWAWGYFLDRYQLLYSSRGATFGAGYTDHVIVRTGLWIMVIASALLAGMIIVNLYIKKIKLFSMLPVVYISLIIILLFLLPELIQNFKVAPNEFELEKPYLKHNIDFTRKAYALDTIERRDYPALADLTRDDIQENRDTVNNIRLWDWRPIRQTYRQTQEIRAYYKFYEIDVDRYHLGDGTYRQVMLSARELEERLPEKARTWVNKYLQFTHGFGLAMSPVSEKIEEGLPSFFIKDLPPVTSKGLEVKQPEIYYGEKTPGYRIVSTGIKEFDYPSGDENVYTSCRGRGGIPLDSFVRKLLFAWELSDINILLTSYITPESKIQLWRRTQERLSRIAPFLQLDRDAYLVLSEGKLYWIQDAYTTSSKFPYSEPYENRLNYIRNSVKTVIDAYNGSVTFYLVDENDPIINMYQRAFPEMFRNFDEMPSSIKEHLRYPQDLFSIQVEKLMTYHMTVPQVFYNREDLWILPREKYAGEPIQLEPYYMLIRLPEEDRLEYLIMTPVTPSNRDNMIAWIAGKSDFPEYGQMIVYNLPKERLIYGPIQIEAMIDQDDVISQQLSLWDQRGSRVIRGNLLVIPLNQSFLYVEPVYLIAEETEIPQLKRVIVVLNKQVVMQPTLEEAITSVFRKQPGKQTETVSAPGLSNVKTQFQRAEDAMREGKWEEFGDAMKELKRILEQ